MKYISILSNRQAKLVKGKRLSCTRSSAPIFIYTQNTLCWNLFYGSRVCNASLFFFFRSSIKNRFIHTVYLLYVSHVISMRRQSELLNYQVTARCLPTMLNQTKKTSLNQFIFRCLLHATIHKLNGLNDYLFFFLLYTNILMIVRKIRPNKEKHAI